MIKFIATVNREGQSGKMLGLGISEGNVEKLRQGMPIVIDLHDVGITEGRLRYVSLFYGGTDAELVRLAKGMAGPETKFSEQKRNHEG